MQIVLSVCFSILGNKGKNESKQIVFSFLSQEDLLEAHQDGMYPQIQIVLN